MPDTPSHRPVIVFSHANSYPAATYRTLFELWQREGFDVRAVPMFGHDARYPVTNNWPHLTQQLVDFIQGPVGRPAYFVGHSLGGFLSLKAALRCPEFALGVVMLDSPIIGGWRAHLVRGVKLTGLMPRVSPGRVALRRRNHWATAEEALQHFAAKPVFAAWDRRVLEDYIRHGLSASPDGHHLAFQRETESAIYNTIPHHLDAQVRRHPPKCPVAFVAGTRSREARQVGLQATRALVGERLTWIEGSHLFPFERPEQTAAEVVRWLVSFGAHPSPGTDTPSI